MFCNLSFSATKKSKNDKGAILEANKIEKNNQDIITASGNVTIKSDDRILKTNKIEYNHNTKKIKTDSSVKIIDDKDSNIYFSKQAEVNDNFTYGDFYNGIILFKNGSNITSPHINRENKINFTIENSIYSLCPTDIYDKEITYEQMIKYLENTGTPLFSLESNKIFTNTDEKDFQLWGTSVWIWKIPIFYIPYFKMYHNNGGNGFTTPGIIHNSNYGYGIYIPYKIFTLHSKTVLKPTYFYKKNNYYLDIDSKIYSFINSEHPWEIKINGKIINDNNASKKIKNAYDKTEEETKDYQKYRGIFESSGFYQISDFWLFDYNFALFSDRYVYRDYNHNNTSYYQSNFRFSGVDLKDNENYNYFEFSNLFYQELRERLYSEYYPKYAPIIDFNIQDIINKNDYNNLYYSIKVNTTNLFRTKGLQYNRLSIIPSINDTFNSTIGTINTKLEIRTDYYILTDIKKIDTYDRHEERLIPKFVIEWRKEIGNHIFLFTPILKYISSPHSRRYDHFDEKIPNEDSTSLSLAFENIFSENKFMGYDRMEYGNRFTYGFEASLYNIIDFGLAQGTRDEFKNENTKIIGFNERKSDYVSYLHFDINNNISLYYRNLTDKDNLKTKKHEINLDFNYENFSFWNIWTRVRGDILTFDENEYEYISFNINDFYPKSPYHRKWKNQIYFGFSYKLYKYWKISAEKMYDFEYKNDLLRSIKLTYDGNCVIWNLSYSREKYLTTKYKKTSLRFDFNVKFM